MARLLFDYKCRVRHHVAPDSTMETAQLTLRNRHVILLQEPLVDGAK
jgi:hypothetical protein